MEGVEHCPEDALIPRDMFLLQVCIFLLSIRYLLFEIGNSNDNINNMIEFLAMQRNG